ncbi:helix-turn-helix transcriptional regulator [Streptomyces sp. YIM 98790]|uniref:helix-turn-helix domain-containing protein n=1 Tax=Streptomyces sp. YIM 98790 TaxID=2689077 RepID=UPI0014093175|nr:helix-turn-helix transcriptional regulator [Streptomyces sp. YIM 98790]
MELRTDDDERPMPRARLARRLRRMRENRGLSLRALADELGYPHTYLNRVERGEQLPSPALAEALDTFFELDEVFTELLELARDASIPDYGRQAVAWEDQAVRFQMFNSSVIPGLLQTEDYARALIRVSLATASEERVQELVDIRMRRKRIFAKPEPPLYWGVMDEAALARPVGGPKKMYHQMHALLQHAAVPRNTLLVLPFSQGEYPAQGGSLVLLTRKNGTKAAYVESFVHGESVETPERVIDLTQRFEIICSKAMPPEDSVDLIRHYLREYEHAALQDEDDD